MAKDAIIYTDGSCHGNPGPGGYAAVLLQNGVTKEVRGSDWYTTNNRMELMAVIQGIKLLTYPSDITIITDSKYVANGINGNLESLVTQSNRKNLDLWQQILRLTNLHKHIKAKWVKGHNGDKLNEKCDSLANREAKKVKEESEIRLFTFQELLKDITVTPHVIASRYPNGHPIDAVQKYYIQYLEKRQI